MKNTIIYLLGYAGTGKYTIAKEICKLADMRLIDNHLINNPVFSLIDLDGKEKLPEQVWENTDRIRRVVLDTMIDLSPPEFNFILTNCLFEDDKQIYDDVFGMVEKRGATFIPITLTANEAEMTKRRTAAGRAQRFKDTCAENVKRDLEGRKLLDISHKNAFKFEVSDKSALEVAEYIVEYVRNL